MRIASSLALVGLLAVVTPAAARTTVTYAMWDGNQMPAYRACADAFEAEHPGIAIEISQTNFENYWTGLTTGFISGDAPDVFVNHVSRFPELLATGQVLDLTPLIARDRVDTAIYRAGLVELWRRDGRQYGLPKDWDTIAIIYNKAMLARAGIAEADLDRMTWNPDDGGSFERILRRLTIDESGNPATSPDFDPNDVRQYGLVNQELDGFGQVYWSHFAASTGFTFVDHPWADAYHYDDPRLARTLTWLRALGDEKGLTPPAARMGKLGGSTLFAAGRAALSLDGDWVLPWYVENVDFEMGVAKLPIGPVGRRSMFNGLADSIWSRTPRLKEAFAWVRYLGSPACQTRVGRAGVVFPAIPAATEVAEGVWADRGLDASAYVDQAKPETTILYPMTDRASEVLAIFQDALERIFLAGADPASTLRGANDEVNALLKPRRSASRTP